MGCGKKKMGKSMRSSKPKAAGYKKSARKVMKTGKKK
jgi:hypothetical protein